LRLFRRLKSLLSQKSPELKRFEKCLQYTFGNTYYLEKSLTHRSIQNHHAGNYERLEFLGDAIIDQVVSYWLFKKYPKSDEGILTKKRSSLVNRSFLSMLGRNLKVMDVVRIEKSVNTKDPKVIANISADVYEAIVGAIYLDGGFQEAYKFINKTLCLSEHLAGEDQNYKGQLIEYCHCNNLPAPQFNIVDSHGPEHEKTFIINVIIDPEQTWRGIGSTKKSAEQNGAQLAINSLLGS
jgi:ribonuclease-3